MFQILLANGAEPSKVPILFEANQGQAPSSVRFLVRTTSYQMFLEEETVRIAIDGQCLTVTLPGALRPAKLAAVDPLQVRTDYLTGNNPSAWRHNVSNYRSVRRESVYQGIDLIFHSNAERVEYDFVVKPGANPGAIRMSIKGGERLRIDTRGRLVAKIGNAEFIQQAPVAYQLDSAGRREPVSARWVLAGARIARFETGPYDRRRTLIVDPEIEAAGVIGGVGKDEWTGLVRAGPQVIAVGVTESLTFPGAYGRRGRNITVAQLDANTLQLQRITYIGGSGTDRPLAATLIAPFLLRIVGQTDSRDFPIVNRQNSRILQPPYGGGPSDGFVCDFLFSGSIFFSTYLGGSGEDRLTAAGGSLIAGETRSTDLPTAISGSYSAGWDVFWAQLDTFSDSFYGGYFGGSGDERVRGIALVDQFAFLAGSTTSPDLALENAWQSQLNGPRDGFITSIPFRVAADGPPMVTSYFGGSGDDEITSMIPFGTNRILLAGTTSSPDFPILNAHQPAYGGGTNDAFLAQLDIGSAKLVSSTYHGGSSLDTATNLSIVGASLFMAGDTASENFPVKGKGQNLYGGGRSDAYLSGFQLDEAQTLLPLVSSQFLGGSGSESVFGLDGSTVGVNSDSPEGAWRGPNSLAAPGGQDGFLFSFSDQRISAPATLVVGKDQVLDANIHLGGPTPFPVGATVTITSGDPSKLLILSSTGLALDTLKIAPSNRDLSFSIEAYADSGEVPITVTALGYPDQIIRVNLVPIRWYWGSSSGVTTELALPMPIGSINYSDGVSLLAGYVSPGAGFVSFPARARPRTSSFFTFRSTNESAVSVDANGTNFIEVTRIGPGEAQIIAESRSAINPPEPLKVTTAAPRPGAATGIYFLSPSFSQTIFNGIANTLPAVSLKNQNVKVRVQDASLAKLVDPITNELATEVELFPGYLAKIVGLTDRGTTHVIYAANGNELLSTDLKLAPPLLRPVFSAQAMRGLRAATFTVGSSLFFSANLVNTSFESLWNVDSVVVEIVSSDPSVAQVIGTGRISWTRGGNPNSGPQIRALRPGTSTISVKIIEGPSIIQIGGDVHITVEDSVLALSEAVIGKDLESSLSLTSQINFPSGTVFTVESADPSKLLVNGKASSTVTGNGRAAVIGITAASLADSGTVPVIVSSPGWPTVTANIQLAPSAFAFRGGFNAVEPGTVFGPPPLNQPRRAIFHEGMESQIALGAFALGSSGQPIAEQSVRAGLSEINLRLSSENPETLAAPLSLLASTGYVFKFTPSKVGQTRFILETPAGFTRAPFNDLDIEIRKRVYRFNQVTLAQDSQTLLELPTDKLTTWTITSNNPAKALVSDSATAIGSASITINTANSPKLYIQALAGSGDVTLEATSPEYEDSSITVKLQSLQARLTLPRIFDFNKPQDFSRVTLTLNSGLTSIGLALMQGPNLYNSAATNIASLRPGVEYRIPVSISNRELGVLSADAFVLSAGAVQQTLNFRPVGIGKADLRIGVPSTLLADDQTGVIQLEVQGPLLRFSNPTIPGIASPSDLLTIVAGRDLVRRATIGFANVEAQGNVRLTIESLDPTRVLLSTAANQAGTASLTLTTRPEVVSFYLHALSGAGEVQIRARAVGYADATATILLRPSGLLLGLPNNSGNLPYTNIIGAGSFQGALSTVVVRTSRDPQSDNSYERSPLRPGANWNPVLKASDPNIIEVITPQPDISTGSAAVQFRAIRPGISNLVVTAAPDIELPRPATVVVRGR